MRLLRLLILSTILIVSCNNKLLQYEPDITYRSSGEGNSPEYFVTINNNPCLDPNNKAFCAFTQKANQDIIVKIPAKQYSYSIDFRCGYYSQELGAQWFSRFTKSVLQNHEFQFTIPSKEFQNLEVFNCRGIVNRTTLDDKELKEIEVNTKGTYAFFDFKTIIVDSRYIESEKIYTIVYNNDNYMVLGKNALYSEIVSKKKTYKTHKQTYFKFVNTPMQVITETNNLRLQYWRK